MNIYTHTNTHSACYEMFWCIARLIQATAEDSDDEPRNRKRIKRRVSDATPPPGESAIHVVETTPSKASDPGTISDKKDRHSSKAGSSRNVSGKKDHHSSKPGGSRRISVEPVSSNAGKESPSEERIRLRFASVQSAGLSSEEEDDIEEENLDDIEWEDSDIDDDDLYDIEAGLYDIEEENPDDIEGDDLDDIEDDDLDDIEEDDLGGAEDDDLDGAEEGSRTTVRTAGFIKDTNFKDFELIPITGPKILVSGDTLYSTLRGTDPFYFPRIEKVTLNDCNGHDDMLQALSTEWQTSKELYSIISSDNVSDPFVSSNDELVRAVTAVYSAPPPNIDEDVVLLQTRLRLYCACSAANDIDAIKEGKYYRRKDAKKTIEVYVSI